MDQPETDDDMGHDDENGPVTNPIATIHEENLEAEWLLIDDDEAEINSGPCKKRHFKDYHKLPERGKEIEVNLPN